MWALVLVAAGVVVVLAAAWLVARRRRPASAPVPPDPFAEPVAQRLPPEADPRRSRDAERRTVARAPIVRPAVVRRDGDGPAEEHTFAVDVGARGALLAGPSDLVLGERLELRLDLGEPVAGRARVVRETPDGMKGVAFETLEADDRARLERYVANV